MEMKSKCRHHQLAHRNGNGDNYFGNLTINQLDWIVALLLLHNLFAYAVRWESIT